MAPMAVIDLSNDPIFDKDKWIQQHGRIFPVDASKVSLELEAFQRAAMRIPDEDRARLLPRPNLSVGSFLSIDLPAKCTTLIHVSALKQFTTDMPLADVSCLKTRKLPSLEFVEDAAKAIGQALLNDAQCINDPNYKGTGLPVWGVQYWIEMHQALKMQTLWRQNLEWLDRHNNGSGGQQSLDQSRALLLGLPWTIELHAEGFQESTRLRAPGGITYTSAEDLTRMLSDRMISTSLMDIMVEEIAARVRSDITLSKKYEIVGLTFMNEIEKAENGEYWERESPPYLRRLEEKLKGSDKCLEFPVYLATNQHFDAFEIDYGKQEICYGKCLLVTRADHE